MAGWRERVLRLTLGMAHGSPRLAPAATRGRALRRRRPALRACPVLAAPERERRSEGAPPRLRPGADPDRRGAPARSLSGLRVAHARHRDDAAASDPPGRDR